MPFLLFGPSWEVNPNLCLFVHCGVVRCPDTEGGIEHSVTVAGNLNRIYVKVFLQKGHNSLKIHRTPWQVSSISLSFISSHIAILLSLTETQCWAFPCKLSAIMTPLGKNSQESSSDLGVM